jgi:hypothetical protein
LIVAKYQSSKWQWVFYSFALIFSWSYHRQGFHRIYYMSDVVWEAGTVYSSRGPVGSVLLLFLIFCIVRFVLFVIVLCLVSSVACVYGLSSLVCDRSIDISQLSTSYSNVNFKNIYCNPIKEINGYRHRCINKKNTMMDMTNRQSNTISLDSFICSKLTMINFSKLEHYKVIKVLSFLGNLDI